MLKKKKKKGGVSLIILTDKDGMVINIGCFVCGFYGL